VGHRAGGARGQPPGEQLAGHRVAARLLAQNAIPGLTEVDTRALVRHIRAQGAMLAALSSDPGPLARRPGGPCPLRAPHGRARVLVRDGDVPGGV